MISLSMHVRIDVKMNFANSFYHGAMQVEVLCHFGLQLREVAQPSPPYFAPGAAVIAFSVAAHNTVARWRFGAQRRLLRGTSAVVVAQVIFVKVRRKWL